MSSPVSNILRASLEKRETLNIVSFLLDGHFDGLLSATGHNIYGSEESLIHRNEIDSKIKLVPPHIEEIDKHIVFDLVVFNYLDLQFEKAKVVSDTFHIPILGIEHFAHPISGGNTEIVFVHDYMKEQAGIDGDVINYGVKDPGENLGEREIDVLVHGSFSGSDFRILNYLKEMQFNIEIWGNNPGYSENITYKELTDRLLKTKVFLNLSTHNGIPYTSLLAMMCGCSILSNKTPVTEHIFNEEFTKLVDKVDDFAPHLNHVINSEWRNRGIAARQFALENYNYDKSVDLWKKKLEAKAKEVYIR